jgi:hypothetical protein
MGRGRLARMRRRRAEALAERLEAPTGLGHRAPGSMTPGSMSAPRASWERGRPTRMPGTCERGRPAARPEPGSVSVPLGCPEE